MSRLLAPATCSTVGRSIASSSRYIGCIALPLSGTEADGCVLGGGETEGRVVGPWSDRGGAAQPGDMLNAAAAVAAAASAYARLLRFLPMVHSAVCSAPAR